MSRPAITDLLLQNSATEELYNRATQAPFLRLAGEGLLSKELLSKWLFQDRLYAQAYVRFIGALISRVHLPSAVHPSSKPPLEWRILSVLQEALAGITTELQFFEKMAKEYDLDIAPNPDPGPVDVTKRYIELFDSFAADPKKSLVEGVVLLWTTEKVYLDSWTYASIQKPRATSRDGDLDGGALRQKFIPNWTSDAFRKFVEDIKHCTDDFVSLQENQEEVETVAKAVFLQALEIEEGFWPDV